MNNIINYQQNNTKILKNIKNIKNHITIVYCKCLMFIIKILQNELINMGWKCDIIYEKDINSYIELNNSTHYFLFLHLMQITRNVSKYKRYIICQLEQNVNNELLVSFVVCNPKGEKPNIIVGFRNGRIKLFNFSKS